MLLDKTLNKSEAGKVDLLEWSSFLFAFHGLDYKN